MAFQTNVLRDGEWVTETVNLQAALKASAAPKPKASAEPLSKPPTCGLLSRTVIQSPIVHRILPVRLRSHANDDIAFIGNNFVQISELQKTGQLHEILRKDDFDQRIRNAIVVGYGLEHSLDEYDPDASDDTGKPSLFLRDTQVSSDGDGDLHQRSLPPQFLVLILESGDLVFIFIKKHDDGRLEFITTTYEGPRSIRYLGHYMAVDPTSRYMTAVSPDGLLVVYELQTMANLDAQYATQGRLEPVKSMRIRTIHGVIHKADFLFPRPEDDYHIILLLFVSRKERGHSTPVSRMVIYEWESGDELNNVFADEKPGTRLPPEHRMPLLLVPIRSKTSFLIVSQNYIGIVKDALSGSPSFEYLPRQPPSRTNLYHGVGEPLWTAWARPFRLKEYYRKTDVIYLAREDGAVQHIEVDIADLLPSVTNVGCLNANIDTAFAASFDRFSDVLIIAGDSGPGGVWKVAPRQDLERVSVLPNWSPVVDATASHEPILWNQQSAILGRGLAARPDAFALAQRDSQFSASGRGLQGTVTEWRWGFRARVGLDLDVGEPTRQAWAFFMETPSGKALSVLLAVPHSSTVLVFSEHLDQVDSLSAENTPFDLSSTTLAAAERADNAIVQVTETFITVVSGTQSLQEPIDIIIGTQEPILQAAACLENTVVISRQQGISSQLHIITIDHNSISQVNTWEVRGEVTCLSLFPLLGAYAVAVGSRYEEVSNISLFFTDGEMITAIPLEKGSDGHGSLEHTSSHSGQLDALTSVCEVSQGDDEVVLVIGTRCGSFITMTIPGNGRDVTWTAEKLGAAPINTFSATNYGDQSPSAFACCDNNLIMLSNLSLEDTRFKSRAFVWPTDSNDASMPSPPIHSLFNLGQNLSDDKDQVSLLLLSGSRILLTEVWSHTGPVPRSIPVNGTPTRIMFSQTYQCLVVGLLVDNKPTLAFIDPDSGSVLSEAVDRDHNPVEFISGLGQAGDRVTGLGEWVYVKDGKPYIFILVTTKNGCLLLVSASVTEGRSDAGVTKKIAYFTRNRKRFQQPIYSVAVDDDGIAFCVDDVVYWSVLDLAEKKLKDKKTFKLGSPATSLQILNGKIHALTTTHSLQILDHRSEASENEMTLLHTDRIARSTTHMIDVGDSAEPVGQWPIFMLSDLAGGIAGVWVPWGQKNKEFTVVFEGILRTPVRRFLRMRSLPARHMVESHRQYGAIASSVDGTETFGVSVSGSLQHFTLLSMELWQLLFLIQTAAQKKVTICPFAEAQVRKTSEEKEKVEDQKPEIDLQPRTDRMHIDGDVVERCLKKRALGEMMEDKQFFDHYRNCLDKLDGGAYTVGFGDEIGDGSGQKSKYLSLGYDILEYLFAPVL